MDELGRSNFDSVIVDFNSLQQKNINEKNKVCSKRQEF